MSLFRSSQTDLVAHAHRTITRTRRVLETAIKDAELDAALLEQVPNEDALRAPPEVCIAGTFKAGKSSLVNALLGQDLAPVDPLPATVRPTRFMSGAGVAAVRLRIDGIWREKTLTEYRRLVDKNATLSPGEQAERDGLEFAEVECNSPSLARLTLIDSPGFDDGQGDIDDAATLQWIERASAVVWVFDIEGGGLKAAELQRVRRFSGERRLRFAVLTKADLKPPSARSQILNEFRRQTAGVFDDVLLFSARLRKRRDAGQALRTGEVEGLTLDLEEHLFQRVRAHGAELVAKSVIDQCCQAMESCRQAVADRRSEAVTELDSVLAANALLLREADALAKRLEEGVLAEFDRWQKNFLRQAAHAYLDANRVMSQRQSHSDQVRSDAVDRFSRSLEDNLWSSLAPIEHVVDGVEAERQAAWERVCADLVARDPDDDKHFYQIWTEPAMHRTSAMLTSINLLTAARIQASVWAFVRSLSTCDENACKCVIESTTSERLRWLAHDLCLDHHREALHDLVATGRNETSAAAIWLGMPFVGAESGMQELAREFADRLQKVESELRESIQVARALQGSLQ